MTVKNASTDLNKILAAANQNRRESFKSRTEVSPEEIERQSQMDATENQLATLAQLGVDHDPRSRDEGGTLSFWHASVLIAEAAAEAAARRQAAASKPASDEQLKTLIVKFHCNPSDVANLTRGEASKLIELFVAQIKNRTK